MSSRTAAPQLARAGQTGAHSITLAFLLGGTVAFITASLPNVTFDLWIGLHASQRDFQWIEQEPLLYANWAPGEPSGPRPAPSGTKPVRTAFCFLLPLLSLVLSSTPPPPAAAPPSSGLSHPFRGQWSERHWDFPE